MKYHTTVISELHYFFEIWVNGSRFEELTVSETCANMNIVHIIFHEVFKDKSFSEECSDYERIYQVG